MIPPTIRASTVSETAFSPTIPLQEQSRQLMTNLVYRLNYTHGHVVMCVTFLGH